MNAIEDLYNKFKQNVGVIDYIPDPRINDDLFVAFRNETGGDLSTVEWDLLERFLYEQEKNWFVLFVLNVLDHLPDTFIKSLLNYIISSFSGLDETNLYLQNVSRIKGFLFLEKKLQDIYTSLCVPRTKHQVHKCFYLNTPHIVPRWCIDDKLEACDKTVYHWQGKGYRSTLEMFNYSKDYEQLLSTEKALKDRYLLLISDLDHCNFPIQEKKFFFSLIPKTLHFDKLKEQKVYETGIEKLKELENNYFFLE